MGIFSQEVITPHIAISANGERKEIGHTYNSCRREDYTVMLGAKKDLKLETLKGGSSVPRLF